MEEQVDYSGQYASDNSIKIRDIEDKQKIMMDRLLLIGQNLIELKDATNQKVLEMKRDIEIIKQNIDRMSSFLEAISGEFSRFAKKEDVEILAKQARMFQPLAGKRN